MTKFAERYERAFQTIDISSSAYTELYEALDGQRFELMAEYGSFIPERPTVPSSQMQARAEYSSYRSLIRGRPRPTGVNPCNAELDLLDQALR